MNGRMLVLAFVFLLSASPSFAQGVIVSGTVVDESGALVPGATVTLAMGNLRDTRTTDAAGEYRFRDVAPGEYEVSAMSPGFSSDRRTGVVVGSAPVAVAALTLTVAGLGETVVVSASRTESTVLDAPATMTVVSGATLDALPSQSYADVLRMVPGMNVVQLSARDINVTS